MASSTTGNASANQYITRAVVNAIFDNTKLNICQINVQSLCARNLVKLEELRRVFKDSKADVVCFTETWLDTSITDSLIAIDGYNLIRNDRNRHGGGICVYYREGLQCRVVEKSKSVRETSSTEFLLLEIECLNDKLLMGVYYNPPTVDCSEILSAQISKYSMKYKACFLIGDFNTDPNRSGAKSKRFNDVLSGLAFHFANREPTYFYQTGCSLLDLLLTDSPNQISKFNQVSMPGISHHDLILASLEFSFTIPENRSYYHDYNNINYAELNEAFSRINWANYLNCAEPDILLEFFNVNMLNLFTQFVPLKEFKVRKNPWFNAVIEKAMIDRDLSYRNWKRSKSIEDKNHFKILRNRVNSLIEKAKSDHSNRILNTNVPSKKLWSNIKNLGIASKTKSPVVCNSSVENINQYFSSNFSPSQGDFNSNLAAVDGFHFRAVEDYEIVNAISSITSNATGLDNIPIRFINLMLPLILPIVKHLFNTIITTCIFPRDWKKIKVIPIKKKSSSCDVTNLRPISLLSSLSKAFEKIIKYQLTEHVNRYDLLHPLQSGFRKGHSTETALIKVHNDVARCIDRRGVAVLLLIDFSKAFDRVSHTKLLNKLATSFGLSRPAVLLIESYLRDRSQSVFLNGFHSSFVDILSGVPQGSVLGPLLFSLFINDLPPVLKFCSVHLFADDVQIYLCSDANINIADMQRKINSDLLKVQSWSEKNLLAINPAKTKALLISRLKTPPNPPELFLKNELLEFVDHACNLGVIFRNNLDWDKQINSQIGKIYGSLKQLNLTTRFLNSHTKLKLFKSLLYPHFIFGDFIYPNATVESLNKLKVALNSCVRYVYNLSRYHRVSHLQKNLIGCSFSDFYKYRSCLTLFRVMHTGEPNYLSSNIIPLRSSRSKQFLIPQHYSTYYSQSLFVRGISTWNLLPLNIKTSMSIPYFKRKLLAELNNPNQ